MELKLTNDEVARALVDRFGPMMGGQPGDTFSVTFWTPPQVFRQQGDESKTFQIKLSECVITRVDNPKE